MSSVRRVWIAWALTRGIELLLFAGPEHRVGNDVTYYWAQLHRLFADGSGSTVLREYPVGTLATMLPEYGLALGHAHGFKTLFALAMLALDAALVAGLLRWARPHGARGAWFWIAFGFVLGPVTYFRFDLVPGVLAVVALPAVRRREATSGAALGAAVVIKGWPVLLLPTVLIPAGSRARRCAGAAVVAAVATAGGLLLGGWERLVSPLHWQQDRGLQIESLVASPSMVESKLDPRGWSGRFEFGARQVHGPWVPAALHVSTALELVTVVVVATLAWRQARQRTSSLPTLAWCSLAAVVLIVVANKTLSPQYLLWVGALAALLLAAERSTRSTALGALLLLVAALTRAVYPYLYRGLINVHGGLDAGTVVLVVRNVLLVAVLGLTLAAAWRVTSSGTAQRRSRALRSSAAWAPAASATASTPVVPK